MPQTMVLVLRTVPVFEQPSTKSARMGSAKKGKRYPFLSEDGGGKGSRTHWYQVVYEGRPGWLVESSYRRNYADLVQGKEHEGIQGLTDNPPSTSGLVSWTSFTDLLPRFEGQTYRLRGAQMPMAPLGLEGRIAKRNIGDRYINCCLFTVSLVTNAMGTPITMGQYEWWMVYASSKGSGHGPAAAVAAGCATMVPDPAKTPPAKGVYLVQDFTRWPKGHSYLVIDWDERTGKMLTLEASSWTVDGVGFKGIGNLRDVGNPGEDWASKVSKSFTWQKRRGDYPEVTMCKLHVDWTTVQAWLNQA